MPRKSDFDWPAHSDELKLRYERGDPTKDIARDFGVTKNQIVSRARTMKLTHPSRIPENMKKNILAKKREEKMEAKRVAETLLLHESEKPIAPPKKYFQPENVIKMPERPSEPIITARPYDTRKSTECAWPIGEGESMMACCRKLQQGQKRYCAEHASLAYAPSTSKARVMTAPARRRYSR